MLMGNYFEDIMAFYAIPSITDSACVVVRAKPKHSTVSEILWSVAVGVYGGYWLRSVYKRKAPYLAQSRLS